MDLLGPLAQASMGAPGASEAELEELQRRLGITLPPSYRQFLATTNGWLNTSDFIDRLLPTSEIGWHSDLDPDSATAWTSAGNGQVPSVSDEDYFVYGDEQDPVTLRV